jgi:hypothetical protein
MDLAQGSPANTFGAASAEALAAAPAPAAPRKRAALRSHPAFAPMLGVWGAGLGLVIVMVLPATAIEAFAGIIPADLPPQAARMALAASAALLLALGAYGTGRMLARRHRMAAPTPRPVSDRVSGKVRPIDPARELGSDSFDAPLPEGLFDRHASDDDGSEDETEWLPHAPDEAELALEAAAELAAARAAPPRDLDLAAFAALEGRNAVWVEEPAALMQMPAEPEPEPEPDPEPELEPNPDPALVSAIARLRAVPPTQLSLCEMVERFAAALQDYRAALEAREGEDESREEREAMLHEALGALGRITGAGLAGQGEAAGPDGPTRRARLWAEANALRDQRGAA